MRVGGKKEGGGEWGAVRVGGKEEEGRRVSDHEYGRYRPGTSGCFIHMKGLEGGKTGS